MIAWLKLLLLGMLVAGSATASWVVHSWKDGYDQRNTVQTEADAAAKQHLALNASNQDTAKRIADLMTTFEGQAHAFAQIDAYLAAHPMGACTFDPATDRLWSDAYGAAFGANQAGSGHGAAGPAAPAAGQHQPAPQGAAGRPRLQVVPKHD